MTDYSFEERKKKFAAHSQRMNVLYQWVRDGIVNVRQFEELIEYDKYLKQKAISDDTFD